jgi:hypothetical protein
MMPSHISNLSPSKELHMASYKMYSATSALANELLYPITTR